jgi:hypothetical protein
MTGNRSTDATSIRRFLIWALCPGSLAPKYPPCSLGEGEACQTHCHVLRSIPSCARPPALTHDTPRSTWKRTSPCAIHPGHGERRSKWPRQEQWQLPDVRLRRRFSFTQGRVAQTDLGRLQTRSECFDHPARRTRCRWQSLRRRSGCAAHGRLAARAEVEGTTFTNDRHWRVNR